MKCRYCGCTDMQACQGGCWWSAPGVCSQCADKVSTVRERPILFSAPMVRAILAGTKTQTRRVVKPQPTPATRFNTNLPLQAGDWVWPYPSSTAVRVTNRPTGPEGWSKHCPYGQPGDRLWVRETWREIGAPGSRDGADYRATYVEESVAGGIPRAHALEMEAIERWRPSIHMPRWASRITLEITDVRVQRLQDISEADAIAEGVKPDAGGICGDDDIMVPYIMSEHDMRNLDKPMMPAPVARFVLLWDSINGKQPGVTNWNANPWVWALALKRVVP